MQHLPAPDRADANEVAEAVPAAVRGAEAVGVGDPLRLGVLSSCGASLLDTASLADACQDEWLVHTEGREYVQTWHWAHWLRSVAPWAQGLIWPSKRDLGAKVTVLFDDRCDPGSLRPGTTHIDLDTRAGQRWLNLTLRPLRVSVYP